MNEEEIRKAIQEKWNELSYEFAVNRTEDGKFTMTDIYVMPFMKELILHYV